MLQRKVVAIEAETKRIARMLDGAADYWFIDVREAPVVDRNAAG